MACAGDAVVKESPAWSPAGENQRLVQSILRGNAAAFDTLVKQHAQTVTSVVRRFLDDPNELEDAEFEAQPQLSLQGLTFHYHIGENKRLERKIRILIAPLRRAGELMSQ